MGENLPNRDRLALLTGTSSGLGSAITKALLREGWTVVGLSRRQVDFLTPRYQHIQVDLSDIARLEETADRQLAPILANHPWQRIGLVNNAASIGSLRSLEESSALSLMADFAVNTVAPIFLMGLLVRLAPPSAKLRIVNISTGLAHKPAPGTAGYGSSKAALRHAGITLAAELDSNLHPGGVRTNVAILSYAPGVVDTPMQAQLRAPGSPWNHAFVEFHATGRLQPPEGPAQEVVNFLAGDTTKPFEERRFGESGTT